ncbi:YkgJ family cysteine cluster protein [Desulfovibrio ferrophilus]|uniref:YkgJ family cysteine cluster protein n=1 Tax=Desulfovibrio ferrophilus TaxID=241368 RepID=A0A2Z6B303_9BACT|nr:YkgJ family cysteine cluster protein [Desulfovibrio ferrophilus]BBD09872.1 uncharacterized protein DFE_3146 [Desulfovibrio ferrophilus]
MTNNTTKHQDENTSGQADSHLRQRLEQAVQFISQGIAEHGLSVPLLGHGMMQFATITQSFPVPDDVECTPGCTYCCHTRVSTSIPEVLIIAQQLRLNLEPPVLTQIQQNIHGMVEHGDPMRLEWWLENKTPCPFLDDGQEQLCLIYEIRPFTCRSHHSTAATACEQGFEEHRAMDVPCYPKLQQATDLYSTAFMIAMRNHGLTSFYVGFIAALDIALGDDTAAGRWLAGQDVFRNAEIA